MIENTPPVVGLVLTVASVSAGVLAVHQIQTALTAVRRRVTNRRPYR